jgi:uncharacterized membrane protein YraQ (UPF0718 family)
MLSAILWAIMIVALLVSWWRNPARTRQALYAVSRSLKGMAPDVLGMIALIGLVLALVPQEFLVRLFSFEGLPGFVLVSLVGALITLPAPIAFPLAASLLGMGAAPAALASFITTLTMVGTVSAPVEVAYFGWRFTLLRQSLSFAAAIAIGLLIGVLL